MNETTVMQEAMKNAVVEAAARGASVVPTAGTALPSRREIVWRILKDAPRGMTVAALEAKTKMGLKTAVYMAMDAGLLRSEFVRGQNVKRYFALGDTYEEAVELRPGRRARLGASPTPPSKPAPRPTTTTIGHAPQPSSATPFGLPSEVLHMNLGQLIDLRNALNKMFSPAGSLT